MKFLTRLATVAFTAALCVIPSAAQALKKPVALFYMMETPKSEASFEAHIDKIGLLVPTWYGVNEDGLVNGAPNPGILAEAHAHHLPVMPIVALADRDKMHAFLQKKDAIKRMADALVRESKANDFIGFQFDFENIYWTDRDAFSAMTETVGKILHKNGLQLSIAVCPNAPGHPERGAFNTWMFKYWRGAYDIAALGKATDFISLMTYDQHTRWTTPGPVGGMPWLMENLTYALKVVPADKISLGIPLYGYHWYTGDPVRKDGTEAANIVGQYYDADEWQPFVRHYGIKLRWDDTDMESWFWFYRDGMREWAFVPDARSFKARTDVMEKYHLQGFSSWVLGSEDPAIWNELPTIKR